MKELIDKFMAGETTVAEEKRLFEAFAPGRDVDPELEPFRPMMQWYGGLNRQVDTIVVRPRRRLPRIAAWTGVAAAVAMLVTVGAGYFADRSQLPDDWQEYTSGCYVIRNGIKYTDLATIMPDMKRAELLASNNMRRADDEIRSSMEMSVLPDVIDMTDPEVCKVINKVLSDD